MTDIDRDALGAKLARLERVVLRLGLADQLTSTTIGTADEPVDVSGALDVAAEASTSIPQLQDDIDEHGEVVSSLAQSIDASMAELDARLELADANLSLAREEIEEAQAEIDAAFGQQVDGLSENVETAIRAAGDARTEAQAASDAALAAAGLAASKGKTIVQVSAPTGANADPANLWINISTDANGVPKNQPNRYNPDTAKWEPITDAQTVAAAQAAAAAVTAAQAAKEVAQQANTAAGVAKITADNANTAALQAAGIANGKGKVIPQASKPTGANAAAGNLWIRTSDNTPWVYDPSIPDWVQVTDKNATDAAAAAAAANQAAVAASNAAMAAQATADGKPLILFSSTAGPSGTAPTGTIWFLWDTAKNVAGQWLQSGTLAAPVWTPQQIRSEVIANLDVAKLTAGSAAIATLVAQKIAASTANFQTANVSNLFVTSGATMSQAVIDYLFANVVQAKKITAGMIDVSTLNGVKLTGVSITGGTLSTASTTDGTNRYVTIDQSSAIFNGREDTTDVYGMVQLTPSSGIFQMLRRNVDNTSSILQVGSNTAGSLTANGRWDASAATALFSSLFFNSLSDTAGTFRVGAAGSLLAGACTFGATTVGSNLGGFAVALKTSTSSFSVTNAGVVKAADYQLADGSSLATADYLQVSPTAAVPVNGTTDVTSRFTQAAAGGRMTTAAWSASGDGFTVPAGMGGMWQLSLAIRSVAGGQAFVQLNGTYVAFQDGTNATLNALIPLAAGDKVRLFMYSTSSANSAQAATRFTALRLGS